MSERSIRFPLLALFLAVGLPLIASALSEETAPVTCGNRLLVGITCSGRYCDNITPICGSTRHDLFDIDWTKYVSEEGEATATCGVANPFDRWEGASDPPAFITGLACKGSYCDDVALECVALRDAFPGSLGGSLCRWTGWVSEETPTLRFPSGFAAVRMQCSGRYCDNKRFFVCPVTAR